MTTSNDTVKRRYVAEWNIEDSEFDVFGWKRTAMVFDSDCQKLESDNKALVDAQSVLFDSYSVLKEIPESKHVSADHVSEVLDAVVRLQKRIKHHGGAE